MPAGHRTDATHWALAHNKKCDKANGGVIMKYLVVEASSPGELQKKVQQYIDQGWEPSGGLAVATYGAGAWWYYQAIIMRSGV
jgi:hypothetical protein